MGRSVITAAEVEAASGGTLTVPADAIITPLARDVAKDRGVTIVQGAPAVPAPQSDDGLATQIRMIVETMLGAGGGHTSSTGGPRPILARQRDAHLEPFPYPGPPPSMSVAAGDVVTADHGSPMAAGYLTLTKGTFPWQLSYDEIQIVLEGELHIGCSAGELVGHPGDILYVPKGSQITFGTPSWAKFVYVTFPANWEEGL